MHILHIRAVCIKSGMRSCRVFAHYNCQLFEAFPSAVAYPDLRMRGGGGRAVIQTPQIRGTRSPKTFFWSKNKEGRAPRASSLFPPLLRILF